MINNRNGCCATVYNDNKGHVKPKPQQAFHHHAMLCENGAEYAFIFRIKNQLLQCTLRMSVRSVRWQFLFCSKWIAQQQHSIKIISRQIRNAMMLCCCSMENSTD